MGLRILAVVYRTPLLLHAAAVFAVGHFIIAEGREGGIKSLQLAESKVPTKLKHCVQKNAVSAL